MGDEFERKYLVIKDQLPELNSLQNKYIEQFYLLITKLFQIRVRIIDRVKAILGFKTKKKKGRIGRKEFEAGSRFGCAWIRKKLLASHFPRVYKTRYYFFFGDQKWEIDVYHKDNEGVIVAEIELPGEDFPIDIKPPWVGREITHKSRYGNINLALRPYKTWLEKFRNAEGT